MSVVGEALGRRCYSFAVATVTAQAGGYLGTLTLGADGKPIDAGYREDQGPDP